MQYNRKSMMASPEFASFIEFTSWAVCGMHQTRLLHNRAFDFQQSHLQEFVKPTIGLSSKRGRSVAHMTGPIEICFRSSSSMTVCSVVMDDLLEGVCNDRLLELEVAMYL
jgi:hypothetical protein